MSAPVGPWTSSRCRTTPSLPRRTAPPGALAPEAANHAIHDSTRGRRRAPLDSPVLCLTQYVAVDIRWARSATKHRISRKRSGHVVRTATTIIKQPPPTNAPAGADDRLVFLGPDQDGTLLEVMAIETDRGLLVIHAMPMRDKYIPYLEEQDA